MKIYNPTLSSKIVKELNYLEDRYFTFDEPIPFKENLYLYPITVEHYIEFINCSVCLTLNKNETAEGITIRHIDYLFKQISQPEIGEEWLARFIHLMELVFKCKKGFMCTQCHKIISEKEIFEFLSTGEKLNSFSCSCGNKEFEESIQIKKNPDTQKTEILILGEKIDANDYDRLRQIIMYQNFPEYKDDSWVHYELLKDQATKRDILMKKNGGRPSASLEKKIVSLSVSTHYKLEEIYKLTMRKFTLLLSTVDDLINYQSDRTAIMSGFVKPPKDFQHWIYKTETNLFDKAVSSDAYTNKINSPRGK